MRLWRPCAEPNAEPNAALPRVLKAGLTRANRSDTEIQNAVDEAVLEVFGKVRAGERSLGGLLKKVYMYDGNAKTVAQTDKAATISTAIKSVLQEAATATEATRGEAAALRARRGLALATRARAARGAEDRAAADMVACECTGSVGGTAPGDP